ncbi:MAG TPA: glutamyl-tRNA reductase [Polyangiales bacterium]
MSGKLMVFGLSYRTAPLPVRERLAVGAERVPSDLLELVQEAGLHEGVLLSTCNRVELVATSDDPDKSTQAALAYFNARVAPEQVDGCVYRYVGQEAARHLFRVASGLDSMVLGEPQILGQVKEAFAVAQRTGTVGTLLGRSFERGFSVAKRVRSETAVAAGNVSVSSIACDLAEKIFGELTDRRVLIVGAGKMSEVAARSLTARGARLFVVNRSPERAQALAQACGGQARPLEALATELAEADVVISSTAKQDYIITYELMQGVCKMRRHRPIFLIDIAVPRDIDPRVDSLRNVFLYDMDDLQKVSRENMAARERAVVDAEQMIEAELTELDRWLRAVELTPTIVALRERVRSVLRAELDKTLPKLGVADKERRALEAMCEAMANKLLHQPLTALKQNQTGHDGVELVEAVQRLFLLQVDPSARPSGQPSAVHDSTLAAAASSPADGAGPKA